jgi:hypothetical protein
MASGIQLGGAGGGTFHSIVVHGDGTADLEGTASIFSDPGSPTLVTVVNKNPRGQGAGKIETYPPPQMHMGKNIGGISPLDTSKLAFFFYETAFREVVEKFK